MIGLPVNLLDTELLQSDIPAILILVYILCTSCLNNLAIFFLSKLCLLTGFWIAEVWITHILL